MIQIHSQEGHIHKDCCSQKRNLFLCLGKLKSCLFMVYACLFMWDYVSAGVGINASSKHCVKTISGQWFHAGSMLQFGLELWCWAFLWPFHRANNVTLENLQYIFLTTWKRVKFLWLPTLFIKDLEFEQNSFISWVCEYTLLGCNGIKDRWSMSCPSPQIGFDHVKMQRCLHVV